MQINHNIPALRALNSLGKVNLAADKHMRNLSSGLRINTAADDAAGLAIANKMRTQVKGLKRASMNSEDGISLVQTAEGALNEVQSMLQRMRELAVQGANGTLEAEDRRAIQNEVEQLKEEITSTANLTEFNKLKLLDGQLDKRSFTGDNKVVEGMYISDTVVPGEYKFTIDELGTKAAVTMNAAPNMTDDEKITIDSGTDKQTGKISINGEEFKVTVGMTKSQILSGIRDLAERVDLKLIGDGDTAFQLESLKEGSSQTINVFTDNPTLGALIGINEIKPDPTDPNDPATGKDAKVTLAKDDPNTTDVVESAFMDTAMVTADGNRITITDRNYQKIVLDAKPSENPDTGEQILTVLDAGPLLLQVGANEGMKVEIQIPKLTSTALGLDYINMRTAKGAGEAITLCDLAIAEISSVRSKLGAYQNRLEYTINNLNRTEENTTAALSRIEDADMASEMAEYTQKNVVSQAGINMLAQANQRPQQVLQLLQ